MKKKSNKLTALVLTLAMLLSLIPSMTFSVSASDEFTMNVYAQMLQHITSANNYGVDDIPGKLIFHAWGWSYQNIMENLENIAEQGFSTILVSPPNEIKMPTKGAKFYEPEANGISPNGWWMLYQPAGFQLNESTDNALGTKSDFVKLCEDAHKFHLKIMVESIVGYMGTDDYYVGKYDNVSENPLDHVNPRAWEFETELLSANAFHSPWVNSEFKSYEGGFDDADIEESLTQHAIDGRPDLATETQLVQDMLFDYFVELVEAGADGFYFNDAKYIETAADTFFPSDFWNDTFVKVREYYPDKDLQAIAEMIDGPGDGRRTEGYLQIGMNLTNTAMSDAIRESVINGDGFTAFFNEDFPRGNSVLWGESYKSYANGETSALTSEQRAKIWALSVSLNITKGIYLARPSDELAENKDGVNNILSDVTLGESNVTDWSTEAIKRINHFASFFENTDETVHYDNGIAVIERGGRGAVLVNLLGEEADTSISEKTLINGNYIDAITGNKFIVENGTIKGEIGESGIAVLYLSDDCSIYNIWIGGEQLTSKNCDIGSTDANITGRATYDSATNTLILNNFTYSVDGDIRAAILYTGSDDLKLVLNGTSSIIFTNGSGVGVDALGNIEISGSGSLSVSGGNYGVNSLGDITILSGNLSATDCSFGVNAMGDITLSGGSLSATGGNCGVDAMGDITLSGGNLSATGDYYGVNAMGDITLSGGTTVAQGGTAAFNKAPTIDDTFTDALILYGESESAANAADAKDSSELTTNYNQKYVCIRVPAFTITFEPNGGNVDTPSMTAVDGKLESLPSATRSGYRFKGWYDVEEGGNEITVDTVFTQDTIVYAQWTLEKEFVDVHHVNHWATADVDYVYINGLMYGVSETRFAPDDSLTRAMLVTVLYRLEGEPATNESKPFEDVDMDTYYANAVSWAKQVGIVNGVSKTKFAPNDDITREQIATIMHRYAQYKGYDVSVGENTNINSYDDFDRISKYAIASMQYAIDSGLINGKSASTLNPLDNATRAETAAILHRFIEANN